MRGEVAGNDAVGVEKGNLELSSARRWWQRRLEVLVKKEISVSGFLSVVDQQVGSKTSR